MFRVDDVYDESKNIIGQCDDTLLFRWMGDVVTIIANKADFEGWKGFLDICTVGCSCQNTGTCNSPAGCGRRLVSLPREVETVIGVNIGGQPALGRHQLFQFHLNGPGTCRTVCEWTWTDEGKNHPTYRDLVTPAMLVAFLQTPEDNGKQIIVYGYDDQNQVLRRKVNGQWLNGILIPTVFGVAVPAAGQSLVSRITGLYKDPTAGSVRISTADNSGTTGVLISILEPDETVPEYRRILLNRSCNWVRIAYLKTNPIFNSRFDHIPLKSRIGFLRGMQARKHYKDNEIDLAHAAEADAARLELEAQLKTEPPVYFPPQVLDMSSPKDRFDYDIR